MDWNDTAEQAAFRSEVSGLIAERLPERYRDLAARGAMPERAWENDRKSDNPAELAAAIDWHAALAERHWVAPHWPSEYGGGGLTPMEQFIFNQEVAEACAPAVGGSGVHMLGPTLIVHGSDEQKEQYLPPILDGEVTWAQGYSEPGSGSDLASLTTRAVRDGDDFIINGQKIWTSAAHTADAMFALVRTDPDAPKHRGISFVMIDDIKTPGITVRPLININGDHYFNEVFFEDVRIPASNLVGELNRGWYVGMTLLDFERSNIGGAVAARRQLRQLIAHIQNDDQGARERGDARAAPGDRGPLRRDRDAVPVQLPDHHDAVGRSRAELRGIDGQAVCLGAEPEARADCHQGLWSARSALERLAAGQHLHEELRGHGAGYDPGRGRRKCSAT